MMTQSPRLLVIRHEPCSSLGMLGKAVHRAKVPFHYWDLSQGKTLPEPVSNYSHIVVLGGAISAYEDDRYPFLKAEFKLLEAAIEQAMPILGICLGSQILARVLGANVHRGKAGREAGWCDVQLTEASQQDPLLQGFPHQFKVFESHQDTFTIPLQCVHLASSSMYPNQAFRYGNSVWGLQFHLEIDDRVLSDCAAVIEQELKDSQIQETTFAQLLAEAAYHAPTVAPLADRFMQQFLAVNTQKKLQKSL